jgi:hypothetical protein
MPPGLVQKFSGDDNYYLNIAPTLADAEISAHVESYVESRLGKEPEGDDSQDDTEQEFIITLVRAGCQSTLCNYRIVVIGSHADSL